MSAKDVILEMLRRHGVERRHRQRHRILRTGARGLSAMDRHVIANMGAELGATTSVFPSDGEVRRFLARQEREGDWVTPPADADAEYDLHDEIDLSKLEPLIAMPSSPGNVIPVREVDGQRDLSGLYRLLCESWLSRFRDRGGNRRRGKRIGIMSLST